MAYQAKQNQLIAELKNIRYNWSFWASFLQIIEEKSSPQNNRGRITSFKKKHAQYLILHNWFGRVAVSQVFSWGIIYSVCPVDSASSPPHSASKLLHNPDSDAEWFFFSHFFVNLSGSVRICCHYVWAFNSFPLLTRMQSRRRQSLALWVNVKNMLWLSRHLIGKAVVYWNDISTDVIP